MKLDPGLTSLRTHVNATSEVDAQGRTSIPVSVRRELGIGTGTMLAWMVEDGCLTVRRLGLHTSAAIHAALFSDKSARRSLADLKAGRITHIRTRNQKR